jgi:hypothetical protein
VSVPSGPLARLNETTVFLGVLVFALVALFVPGVLGGVLLLIMVLALAALAVATWGRRRALVPHVLRVAVLLLFLVVALTKMI